MLTPPGVYLSKLAEKNNFPDKELGAFFKENFTNVKARFEAPGKIYSVKYLNLSVYSLAW